MTKEQATEVLHELDGSLYETQQVALDMAIKALEQQPSDESIKYLECNGIDVQKFTEAVKMQPLQIIKPNTSDDCVSRQATLDAIIKELCIKDESYLLPSEKAIYNVVKNMPPVTPTQCIATVQFSKEDLREICNERIEIECTHGACKDCKFNVKSTKSTTMCDIGHRFYMREPSTFYCADFVKRGDSDGSN